MNRAGVKNVSRHVMVWVARTILAVICSCSSSPISTADGGGSRGGNPVVTGMIVTPEGEPANNVLVWLIDANHNPMVDTSLQLSTMVTTDSSGLFSIEAPDSGNYTIEAKSISDGNRLIKFNIRTYRDSVCTLTVDTLHSPGVLRLSMPENSNTNESYIYLPGTNIGAWLTGAVDIVIIDSVPAGVFPFLYYVTKNGLSQKAIRNNILVRSSDTTVIGNLQWSNCCRIILNTSPTGADVNGNIFNFPVLIRLNSDNFSFAEAQTNGEDLLFTNLNGRSFPYEIVKWDASSYQAQIWVNIDTVYGNDSTQSIMMYWGNPNASTVSNSTLVFDTAAGFQGVWHLEEKGNDPALDATFNGFNGTAYHMPGNAPLDGVVGNARTFDGDSSYITMLNTAGGKLNYPEDGNFTVSAWVYVETFDNSHHTIVAKGFKQYFLQLSFLPAGEPKWEFSTFNQEKHWLMSNFPATEKKWMLLTGVKHGSSQYLFCNGELVAGTSAVYTHNNIELNRDTTEDLSIGRFITVADYPVDFGYCYFKGMIDEVQISSVVRNEDWIKLSYMNQRRDGRLVQFKR